MNKTILIVLFFLIGCGYQPVYLSKNIGKIGYSEIIQSGDNNLNRRIINTLSIKEKKGEKYKLYLSSSSNVESTSKNTIGQSVSFRTTLIVDLKIDNIDEKTTEDKQFIKEFNYNNKESKSELVEYQDSIKNDLTNQVINEIAIYLNAR